MNKQITLRLSKRLKEKLIMINGRSNSEIIQRTLELYLDMISEIIMGLKNKEVLNEQDIESLVSFFIENEYNIDKYSDIPVVLENKINNRLYSENNNEDNLLNILKNNISKLELMALWSLLEKIEYNPYFFVTKEGEEGEKEALKNYIIYLKLKLTKFDLRKLSEDDQKNYKELSDNIL